MDVFSWMRVQQNWGLAALVSAGLVAAAPDASIAANGNDSSVVVIVDDGAVAEPAATIASDASTTEAVADSIQWAMGTSQPAAASTPAAAPKTGSADINVVANDSPPGEPLRAARPTFITDGNVAPASLYSSGAVFMGSSQPLRRGTTLQLRQQSGGRSLAERLGMTRDDPEQQQPAPEPAASRPTTKTKQQARAPREQQTEEPATGQQPERESVSLDPLAARLLKAHELSLAASSEGEYSQIIQLCGSAMREGASGDQRDFAVKLAAWALNRRGEARTEDGQDGLAMADFRAALDYDPNHWRTLHNRAVTYAQQGQFAEAFDDIARVLELNPNFAKAYANRATLYVQAGDTERALADYAQAIELDGQLTAARAGRGRLLHMLGRWEEALDDFNAAIDVAADDAPLYCSRGDLQADLGDYSAALADYAAAVDADPECAHAYRNGAWLLATCPDASFRDAEHALIGAEQALSCGYGERHAALDCLAAALANAGRFDEALVAEQQAIDIAPEQLREGYQVRLQMYEANQPYRTSPVTE